VADQYLDLVSYYQKNGILVTDSVDVHFNRTQNEMANKLITESYFKKEKKRELSVYKKSNVTIVVSKEDGSILESHGVNHVSIISIIVPSATRKLIENEKNNIIFVGGFIHRPNVKALEWFLGNVWDKIKSQNKNIVFNIVGANLPDRLVKQIDSLKDVNYLGFIPNLNEEYDKSILAIAPLTYGGGVKGKVCEAMAHGIPLVTTTVGVEGIQAINGKDCFIADDVHEFSQRVLQLADDTDLQVLFTKNSQILADKTCGMENAKNQISKLLINLDEIKVEKPSRSYIGKIIKANYQLANNSIVHLSKKIRKKYSI
jgi:glycosyltransferase involved in cell wall biosynthesis